MLVACLSCKRVIWAYNTWTGDIRGIANYLKLPCPKCGAVGDFDGWSSTEWFEMHEIAEREGLTWEPDGQCRWFGDLTYPVADYVSGANVQIGRHQMGVDDALDE